jgi:DNA polymerase-4
VQPISIDEAFLDLAGTERLHKDTPARTLARFAARVEAEIGITLSVGSVLLQVSRQGRFRSRQAARLFGDRQAGGARLSLAPGRVTLIWGVGKAFAATLERDGIRTIGQLQTMEERR